MEQYCESNVWTYELLDWINEEKISWCELSRNPNAIDLLERNPEKIHWFWLSQNPNATRLLEKNPEKICWSLLSHNPSIFKKTINYEYLYQRMNIIIM